MGSHKGAEQPGSSKESLFELKRAAIKIILKSYVGGYRLQQSLRTIVSIYIDLGGAKGTKLVLLNKLINLRMLGTGGLLSVKH